MTVRALLVAAGLACMAAAALALLTLPQDIRRGGLAAVVVHDRALAALKVALDGFSFDLAAVRKGRAAVPRLYVTRLPAELSNEQDLGSLKSVYLRTVLPLVLMANEEVMNKRARLQAIIARRGHGEMPTPREKAWFAQQIRAYRADDLDDLLRRMDGLPPSLVLAQAILESGWGRSRFAQTGNALFGQRTWTGPFAGQRPRERSFAVAFRVRSYQDIMASVRSYLHNINSHPAYAALRAERAGSRDAGSRLRAADLLPGLLAYAEQGEDYLARLRRIIDDNRLEQLDGARLEAPLFQ